MPIAFLCFAEKDEEGTKLLESVKVVTAKTGTTVDLSECALRPAAPPNTLPCKQLPGTLQAALLTLPLF